MDQIDDIVIAVGGKGDRVSDDLNKRGIFTSKVFLKYKGKPILNHLVDMSLELNFNRIYLLSSYYDNDLRIHLMKYYPNVGKIIPIYGNKKGRALGTPWVLSLLKNKINKPFIYSDGNILYNQNILNRIKNKNISKTCFANLVLSEKDFAPTHLKVTIKGKKIHQIQTRLSPSIDRNDRASNSKIFYSMGLMILNSFILHNDNNFAFKKDLDCIICDVFNAQNKCLIYKSIYKENWHAVHTIQDVDKLSLIV